MPYLQFTVTVTAKMNGTSPHPLKFSTEVLALPMMRTSLPYKSYSLDQTSSFLHTSYPWQVTQGLGMAGKTQVSSG